jgi:hypothetical protein
MHIGSARSSPCVRFGRPKDRIERPHHPFFSGIHMKSLRIVALAVFACFTLLLSACGGSYSRGIFEGQVMGQTESSVVEKVGKPDVTDLSNDKSHKFIYKGRTFDTNANGQKDVEAIITFEKDASGQYVATAVYFS